MKGLLLVSLLLFGGCSVQKIDAKKDPKNMTDVEKAVQQAVDADDFRFYATAQRRTVFPGLDEQQHAGLIKACGYRFLQGTGDVLKHPDDLQKREQKIAFATAYNQTMLTACRQRQQVN